MTEKCAWVTLATNDAYSLGALVLAHSLRRVATQHELVILITPSVTPTMRERLQSVFSEVITVDVLDSKDAAHLALLSRPELGITFTKIHCWNLIQYKKCVFLDADTLVFQNCDELFEREELSAAPDVGWPDCFNSGVFVYQPSNETFDALIKFAQEKGSFDGGDQGLLNQFFSNWAREDIKKHLPFVYNVCSTAFYSYLPALKQYGSDMKIMHFIGNLKPWLQRFNWSSRTVAEQGYLQAPLQYWWDIFLDKVHPSLDSTMAQWECGVSSEPRYQPPQDETSPFPWHHPLSIPEQMSFLESEPFDFYDPWENYATPPTIAPALSTSDNSLEYITASSDQAIDVASDIETKCVTIAKPWYETYTPIIHENFKNESDYDDLQSDLNVRCNSNDLKCETVFYNHFENTNGQFEMNDNQNTNHIIMNIDKIESNKSCESVVDTEFVESKISCNNDDAIHFEEVKPRHPYDNYYLIHKPIVDNHGCKRCAHEELSPEPSPPPTPSEDSDIDLQAGIAGALSQLTIGTSEQGSAVDEHLRRQGWESGNIDYMGADAFNNIWAKISQTLSSPPPQAAPSQPEAATPSQPEAAAPSQPEAAAPATETSVLSSIVSEVPKSIPEEKKDLPSVPVQAAPQPLEKVEEPAQPSPVVPQASPPVAEPKVEQPAAPTVAPPAPKVVEQPAAENVEPLPPQVAQQPPSKETEQVQKASKDSKAIIEEKQDSKQAEKEDESTLAKSSDTTPPPKPIEKLVCHLRPIGEVEPLVTPENEHEDAATIAQSIIAGEEALSTPNIISATPPANFAVCPIIPQNIKDLSVDTSIPETPPVPGPVSLAQIGVIPPSQPEKPEKESVKVDECPIVTEKTDILKCDPQPQKKEELQIISCEGKSILSELASSPENIETIVLEKSIETPACLLEEKAPETCEIKKPSTPTEKPKRSTKPKVEKKASVESQPENKELKKSVSIEEKPSKTKVELPKQLSTEVEKKSEPSSPKEVTKTVSIEDKSSKSKSALPKQSSTEIEKKSEPSTPKEEVAPPQKMKKSQKSPKAQPASDSKASQETVPSPAEAVSEKLSTESKVLTPPASPEPIISSETPLPVSEAIKDIEKPAEAAAKDATSDSPAEKPKKTTKKPQPTPKEKADDTSVPKSTTEPESAKKSEDKPVPPPRKKEKKPKDSKK